MVRFKAKLWTVGNSTVITVPKKYIKNGLLWTGEEFEININPYPDK